MNPVPANYCGNCGDKLNTSFSQFQVLHECSVNGKRVNGITIFQAMQSRVQVDRIDAAIELINKAEHRILGADVSQEDRIRFVDAINKLNKSVYTQEAVTERG